MSTQSVTQFLERVETDEKLQQELAQIVESSESGGENADRQGATELGKKYGYEFSSDELWAEIQKRQGEFQQRRGSGVLSDDELETVAGGGEIWITTVFTATASIATAIIPKIKW